MHCAGQHKPYAEWHKPCRYYRLLFRNLQAPPQIPATVFCDFPPALTTTLLALLPMAYAADFRGRFSTALIAAPFLLLASVVVFVGRFQPPSPSPDWDFRRFPLCGPLSRTAAEIFTGFLGATRVLWKLPRRRLPHFWGACAFYLLSMVSLHTKTSFLTKPHGSKLSLSSFYGLSHGTGQPLPQFAVPIDHMLPVAYSQRLVVPLTMDIF